MYSKMSIPNVKQGQNHLPSGKLTVHPWQIGLERLVSILNMGDFQGRTVYLPEGQRLLNHGFFGYIIKQPSNFLGETAAPRRHPGERTLHFGAAPQFPQ